MNDFCVYLHRKATNGEIFYVGKGKGRRAYDMTTRNNLWSKVKNKYGIIVEVYAEGLQEWYAYELENLLITGYGKICDGTGTLSNILDGHEYRYESKHGSNAPYSKKGKHLFRRLKDDKLFFGTRKEFEEKYNLSTAPLFVENTLSSKGWILDDKLLQSEIAKIGMREEGVDSWLRDTSLYTFFNLETKELLKCTKLYFYELGKLGSNQIDKLFLSARGSDIGRIINGWVVLGITPQGDIDAAMLRINITGSLSAKNVDTNTYKFTNIYTNEIYIGYRYKFVEYAGINRNNLSSVINGSRKHVNGWIFTEII